MDRCSSTSFPEFLSIHVLCPCSWRGEEDHSAPLAVQAILSPTRRSQRRACHKCPHLVWPQTLYSWPPALQPQQDAVGLRWHVHHMQSKQDTDNAFCEVSYVAWAHCCSMDFVVILETRLLRCLKRLHINCNNIKLIKVWRASSNSMSNASSVKQSQ